MGDLQAGARSSHNKLVVIAGPTASGKSRVAATLAESVDAVVINADSMQVYQGAPILTAQPSAALQARLPHRLYGLLPPEQLCSAGRWRALALAACAEAWRQGRLPLVVGGSGLYLKGLLDGLSGVPEIPAAVREASRALFASLGNADFHRALASRDPVMAARLDPGNSQRLVRAWEVLEASGRSLADWQADAHQGGLRPQALIILLSPGRDALYHACDARLAEMLGLGALDEVAALLARRLAPDRPLLKALGVAEFARHLAGEVSLTQALAQAQLSTRRYAKRQTTWFRHQLIPQMIADEQFSESLIDKILSFIRQFLLTAKV